MADQPHLSSEENLLGLLQTKINDFFQQGMFASFAGEDNVRINYCAFIDKGNHKNLIIVPGRMESYLKYQELAFDFFHLGYNIFILDHRGQGLSQRLLTNKLKGHVSTFNHYVADLKQFIQIAQALAPKNHHYLLAHSMGGAIAINYLAGPDTNIKAAALAAPMIDIDFGKMPKWLAKTVIILSYRINRFLNRIFETQPWYFLSQGKHCIEPFDKNHLSHSKSRYHAFAKTYQQHTEIALKGVTTYWLAAALRNTRNIFKHINKLTTPLLVLQAELDTVVDNKAQQRFCQNYYKNNPQPHCQAEPLVYRNSFHEIFFETDLIRHQAIKDVDQFFQRHE